MLCTLTVRLLV